MTVQELGNQFGYQCPQCKAGDNLSISAWQRVTARLYPDGTDNDGGDTEWEDDDSAYCYECDWEGQVKDLLTIEVKE